MWMPLSVSKTLSPGVPGTMLLLDHRHMFAFAPGESGPGSTDYLHLYRSVHYLMSVSLPPFTLMKPITHHRLLQSDRAVQTQGTRLLTNVPWQRWLPTPAIFQPTGDLAQKSMYTCLSIYKHAPQLNARHIAFSNTLKFHVTDEVRSHWWLSPHQPYKEFLASGWLIHWLSTWLRLELANLTGDTCEDFFFLNWIIWSGKAYF